MTISEAIRKGMIELKNEEIEEPKLKARLLMQYILEKPRQYVVVNDMKDLNKNQENKFFTAIKDVKNGCPIEHIIHFKEFMGLGFYVDENVLIPRQDTEALVEEVIDIAKKTKARKILDLCTGSGAIAISLAKYLTDIDITAVDLSGKALRIAKKNAIKNGVKNKIEFIKSDMFENIKNKKFDIIVSNPPYIKKDVIKDLSSQVKKEPIMALDGGEDGLDFYREIINNANQYLRRKGFVCLEIGYDQKKDVFELIKEQDIFEYVYYKKDLYGIDRVVVTQL